MNYFSKKIFYHDKNYRAYELPEIKPGRKVNFEVEGVFNGTV